MCILFSNYTYIVHTVHTCWRLQENTREWLTTMCISISHDDSQLGVLWVIGIQMPLNASVECKLDRRMSMLNTMYAFYYIVWMGKSKWYNTFRFVRFLTSFDKQNGIPSCGLDGFIQFVKNDKQLVHFKTYIFGF